MPQPKTRTWSTPTSPRSPHKLPSEMRLIAEFDGRIWNTAAQVEFIQKLPRTELYEGAEEQRNPDLAARDRVNRSPKTFGLIKHLSRTQRPLTVTNAGREMMLERELDDLFLRQFLKWQYPSPNHDKPDYRNHFFIKPFLETLRLIRDLDGLTKPEIALFVLSLTDYRNYDATKTAIERFRVTYSTTQGKRDRLALIQETLKDTVRTVYADDIAAGNIGTREGGDTSLSTFVTKKAANLRDYADSTLRYFLATGLFQLSASGRVYRLKLLAERVAEADQILRETDRNPLGYADVDTFFTMFGDPLLPLLPSDDVVVLRDRILAFWNKVSLPVRERSGLSKAQILAESNPIALKSFERELKRFAAEEAAKRQQQALQQAEAIPEILDMYEQITARNSDIPDRPLFFEWNTWRALSALDDGRIVNNFTLDADGNPRSVAPGNSADIECDYAGFALSVEVTLSRGATQYKMEGEPVNRHVGVRQKALRDAGDMRPVYGLFVAESINASVLAHFYGLHRVKTREFGGAVSVIPLPLQEFAAMLKQAKDAMPIPSQRLATFFDTARQSALDCEDEVEWGAALSKLSRDWLGVKG